MITTHLLQLFCTSTLFMSTPFASAAPYFRWPDQKGNPHFRASRILAPVRPRMQAAGLQCLMLQIVASPNPQTRAFPGTEFSRNYSVTQLFRPCPEPLPLKKTSTDSLPFPIQACPMLALACREPIPARAIRLGWLNNNNRKQSTSAPLSGGMHVRKGGSDHEIT